MSTNIPEDLHYTKSHEWVRDNQDGTVTIGITDHAQESLGDIVYVELPEEGSVYGVEDGCGVIESVKAASDLYSPVTGEVTEVNADLEDSPELVNSEPYGDGWIMTIKLDSMDELKGLLDADAYVNEIAE